MPREVLDHGTFVYTMPGTGFGTDALLLARFAQPHKRDRTLDLCSGCGIVALVWHDAGYRGPCTALELDHTASTLCAAAVAQQPETSHIEAVCGDLRQFCQAGRERGKYDFVACNPPYFTSGPKSPDARRARARHNVSCTLEDVVECAARALKDGGKLVLCHRPDQMVQVFCTMRAARLEPKRAALVKSTSTDMPWLFLVEAQKNRHPGLRFLPDILVQAGAAAYGAARENGGNCGCTVDRESVPGSPFESNRGNDSVRFL